MTSARRPHDARLGLGGLQRWLFERVTSPHAAPLGPSARRVTAGGLPATARLEVYRQGYFSRLTECLADDYPAVAHALGPVAFEALCRAYIDAHPPRSASLNFYGAAFAGFCRGPGALVFEADLARLEWAVVEAIHADATATLDLVAVAALGQDQWARARLVPSPALRLVRGSYPVYDYYRAFLDGENPSAPPPAPSAIAVCRRDDDVWRLRLGEPLADLLGRLIAGERLAAALDAVSGSAGALSAGALERAFGEWVTCGFFAALASD